MRKLPALQTSPTATSTPPTSSPWNALKEVKTKAELEALMAKLDQQTLERSSQFIMSGYAVDGTGNDVFNIPGSESGEITSFECTLTAQTPGRQGGVHRENGSSR